MAGVLEPISEGECWQLLAEHDVKIGRVSLAEPAPSILPVNYAVDDRRIVFRTAEDTTLDLPVDGVAVAFEADQVSGDWRGGWSVLVRGRAARVADPDEVARLQRLGVEPWAPVGRVRYIRIDADSVSGRRIVPHIIDPLE